MKKIVVINDACLLAPVVSDLEIVTPAKYLFSREYATLKNVRLFNLSAEYRYQSRGYYVSLLAEARGHKPIPSIKNIQDLKTPEIVKIISDELNSLIQKSLGKLKSREFTLSVYFGRNVAHQYDKLASELHSLFPVPLFRVNFIRKTEWQLQTIKAIGFNEVPESHIPTFQQAATAYFNKKRYRGKTSRPAYDLAILVNREESSPPSNERALSRFMEAAEKEGIVPELISHKDYNRIGEYDALFIRETTSVNHASYRFARRAQSEGMVVIDDPDSILRCSNKVYLAELLSLARIPVPKTVIISSEMESAAPELPCVLKLPDSSFSQGVVKVETEEEFIAQVKQMLKSSDLIIGQEFLPSPYDWRIGFLDNQPLFACKYFMARNHWQIYNWNNKNKNDQSGDAETVQLGDVPGFVLETAARAAKLVGTGLYGVDVKEIGGKAYIMEINDNPNIDAGIEDKMAGDGLYLQIIRYIISKLRNRYNEHS